MRARQLSQLLAAVCAALFVTAPLAAQSGAAQPAEPAAAPSSAPPSASVAEPAPEATGEAVSTQADPELTIETDPGALSGLPLRLTLGVSGVQGGQTIPVSVRVNGLPVAEQELGPGEHEIVLEETRLASGKHRVRAEGGGATAEAAVRVIPGWLSILPPLIAIGLALAFKDVLLSLAAGIFSGALFLSGWNPFAAFARCIDTYIAPALGDPDHARIIVFTTLLGGMVGVIGRSGGTQGIVDRLSRFATSARRGQVATWVLGVLIFFDDYANTLVVGPTMRPITDKLRVSREKLAYIVDSTAAPVASVVPISTWIGFEIGLIGAAFTQIGLDYNAFLTLVASIPYRFYPVFALVLGFTIAFSCRDMGPMLKAELRASTTGKLVADGDTPLFDVASSHMTPPEGVPRRAINAVLPILAVITVTLGGLYATGAAALATEGKDRASFDSTFTWVREVFGSSDSYSALLWASLSGVALALLLAITQRVLTIRQSMEAMVEGFKSMMMAFAVLILAWSIGSVCDNLHTADFVVDLTKDVLTPHWLPVLVFLVSAAISFATGASWGTMGILMPLVIPLAHGLSTGGGLEVGSVVYDAVLVGTISSVLAGSVWGDHCSPISDTTILSSMASGCDHIAHVRTQMPYALAIGVLGMLLGDIPTAFGLNPFVSLAVGAAVIVAGVFWFGKRSDWRPGAAA